uniref:Zinc-binding loop region of homing endonuclease domain-containing protein n=1 Tax=Magallana gigas TaxID=29159 RepID=K1QCF1_MAGGI
MEDFFEQLRLRILEKSEIQGGPGGCFVWKGATTAHGYGVLRVRWPEEGPKFERVHRAILMAQMRLTRSQFPGGNLEVSHLCRKKLCVNATHLVLETHEVNQERNHCKAQGFCCRAHHPHCILPCN